MKLQYIIGHNGVDGADRGFTVIVAFSWAILGMLNGLEA